MQANKGVYRWKIVWNFDIRIRKVNAWFEIPLSHSATPIVSTLN